MADNEIEEVSSNLMTLPFIFKERIDDMVPEYPTNSNKSKEESREKGKNLAPVVDEPAAVRVKRKPNRFLSFDYWSGRYFYSDVDYIESVINRLGADLLRETMAYDDAFISYNDIYREIGLPDAGSGEDQIWRVKKKKVFLNLKHQRT